MADKVNNEECIARVYQFLNTQKNWQAEADGSGDGIILKAEFRKYLLGSNFKFNNGENKEDLVDAFWKSIDTDRTGKVRSGSRINDKNALNVNEIDNVEKSIQATKQIIAFMKDKEAPQSITDSGLRSKWKTSVKQGLIYRASEFLKNASLEDLTDEWLNEAYRQSSIKATADYTALSIIEKKLGNIDNYKVGSDENLKAIIDAYIAELEGSTKSEEEIIADVNALINAYIDTAETNSEESTDLLYDYGYNPDGDLNDLQTAVLTKQISEQLITYIQNNNSDIYTDEYKGQIENSVKEFVENYLKGRSASEFNTLKAFDTSVFASSSEYTELVKELKAAQEAVRTARSELNTYIGEILSTGNTKKADIIKQALNISSTDATTILNRLLELKTTSEISAVRAEIDRLLAEYETERKSITDHSDELKKKNPIDGIDRPTFYVSDDGSIVFVNYGSVHGVFDDKPNTSLNIKFKILQTRLESAYKEDLEKIGLSSSERKNLFNAAMYMALSDESVLKSQYEMADLKVISEAVIDNYTALLKKVAASDTAREYIKNYLNSSIIAGRSPRSSISYRREYDNSDLSRNMDKYYTDDSTEGGDDWVSVRSYTTHSTNFGDIIYLTSVGGGDCIVNEKMEGLLYDYISSYCNIIDKSRITELFKEAQEIALDKLNSLTNCTNPEGTSVYGYGECASGDDTSDYDTKSTNGAGEGWISVPAILIEIMYEMERLIAKEIFNS